MADPHPLILSLRCAGLKDVDTCNLDEMHSMWAALSRAKNCIDGGDRLEYLSWRIYSREILARKQKATSGLYVQADAPLEADSASEPEADGNDSDFESYSEDSVEEIEAPRPGDKVGHHNEAPVPKHSSPANVQAPRLAGGRPKSLNSYPHRRISSIELQHLFKEARKLDPSELKSCALSVKQCRTDSTEEPIQVPDKSSGTVAGGRQTESSQALSTYHQRFGVPAPVRASSIEPVKGASTQSAAIRNSSSALFSPIPGSANSTAVRGFSPSSVSVSVFMNRGLASKSDTNDAPNEEHKKDGKPVTWKKASLPREKIFFIEAESDSDASSAAGSPDRTNRTSAGPSKAGEKHLHIVEPEANNVTGDFEAVEDEDEEVEEYGSSGWDDTSGEEDNSDEEHRPENMFKERAVPSKPLLKRSLLSTLFVNDMNPAQPEEDVVVESKGTVREVSPTDRSSVTAPVDILLGAAVAPHIPLPVASPRTVRRDMFQTELSQSLRDNMKQSRHFDVDHLFPQRLANNRSLSDPAADFSVSETSESTPTISSLHMTARPEMYRASTDTGIPYRRPSDERGAWQSQHEDIYDPMNYHSRGW